MRPRGLVLALAALLPAACREPAPPQPKNDMAIYQAPQHLFSCDVPAQWRVIEDQGGAQRVSFLGPPDGPHPFWAAISVYHYAKTGSDYASPQDYAKRQALGPGKTGALLEKPWKGAAAYEFSATRPQPVMHQPKTVRVRQERTALIPTREGFLALVYSAPEDRFAKGEPVFQALLDSLRLEL